MKAPLFCLVSPTREGGRKRKRGLTNGYSGGILFLMYQVVRLALGNNRIILQSIDVCFDIVWSLIMVTIDIVLVIVGLQIVMLVMTYYSHNNWDIVCVAMII